jgi:hypothetical protein
LKYLLSKPPPVSVMSSTSGGLYLPAKSKS